MSYQKPGSPFMFDDASGDIVGIKDPDGSELSFLTESDVTAVRASGITDGTLSAVVAPRTGTLSALLAVAGVFGETSAPSDYERVRVRHNAVAGEAYPDFSTEGFPTVMKGVTRYVQGQGFSTVSDDWVELTSETLEGHTAFNWHPLVHGNRIHWVEAYGPSETNCLYIDMSRAMAYYQSFPDLSGNNAIQGVLDVSFDTPTCTALKLTWDSDSDESEYVMVPARGLVRFEITESDTTPRIRVSPHAEPTETAIAISATGATTNLVSTSASVPLNRAYAFTPAATYAAHTLILPYARLFAQAFGNDAVLGIRNTSSSYAITTFTVSDVYGGIKGTALTTLAASAVAGYKPITLNSSGWVRVY